MQSPHLAHAELHEFRMYILYITMASRSLGTH